MNNCMLFSILTDCSNNAPSNPYRYYARSACIWPWGHTSKCWSPGSDSCYRQPHHPEACCHWNFGARQVHGGSSEDHMSYRDHALLRMVQQGRFISARALTAQMRNLCRKQLVCPVSTFPPCVIYTIAVSSRALRAWQSLATHEGSAG